MTTSRRTRTTFAALATICWLGGTLVAIAHHDPYTTTIALCIAAVALSSLIRELHRGAGSNRKTATRK